MYASELGAEYYETTAHAGARPSHSVWQGKVFKIEGTAPGYENFYEATGYGTGAGLCGWNCRHSFYPYWPGVSKPAYTKDDLEDYSRPKYSFAGNLLTEYECMQKQREYERAVREYKRILAAYDSYIQTVKCAGLYADAETADLAAHKSMGHPYMVQLVGYYMWRSAVRRGSQVIERRDVEDGHADAVSEFYEAVDAPLYYGLRSPQRLFIEAMAVDEGKPTRMADIIERCDRTQSWASKYRASLIRERVIEAAGYGLVRFSVPMLGEYIRDRILWHE